MARIFDVMVAGHLCLDLTPRFIAGGRSIDAIMQPGQLVKVGDAALRAGASGCQPQPVNRTRSVRLTGRLWFGAPASRNQQPIVGLSIVQAHANSIRTSSSITYPSGSRERQTG